MGGMDCHPSAVPEACHELTPQAALVEPQPLRAQLAWTGLSAS